LVAQLIRRLISGLLRRKPGDPSIAEVHSRFSDSFGVVFNDPYLLKVALTHRSSADPEEGTVSNERLEFLGDSVLGLVTSDHLFHSMSDANEGELTKARSRLVNKAVLGRIGAKIGILDLLLYAREEIRDDERALVTLSADALEAVIGAIYLDQGFKAACEFVIDRIVSPAGEIPTGHMTSDYKSRLQEICQARFKVHPEYRIIKRVGPEHRRVFHVEVRIRGETYGSGSGRSRKEAEQVAAGQALVRLSSSEMP
jgi:ribonuclease-3